MNSNLLSRASTALNTLYMALCILFFAALAYNHFQVVTYAIPIDRNEAGMLSITATIAKGENPYALANQPANASVYPVLYNIAVAPLSLAFGNTLLLHRIVAGILIFASCYLLFYVVRHSGASNSNSLAAAALYYAGLLYYSTPIASPNSLGILLFLLSLFIPWFYAFSNRSLLSAAVLGVLAFYTKQYFVASLGYLALYLFLAVSKKRALVFASLAFLFLALSIVLVNYTSPYFLDNTVFSVRTVTRFVASDNVLYEQLLGYSKINLPILAIVVLLLLIKGSVASAPSQMPAMTGAKRGVFNLRDRNAPLLNRRLDYIWYCFACSVLIILELGKNRGNQLTYLFQLLSPFLLAGTFIGLSRLGKLKWLGQLLVLVAFYNSYTMLSHDFSIDDKNWARLQQEISTGKTIYGSTITLVDILKNDGEVFQNGHTPYTRFAVWKPAFFNKGNPEENAAAVWDNYVTAIHHKIETQEFDLIILDQRTKLPERQSLSTKHQEGPVLLRKYYRLRQKIPLTLSNRLGGGKLQVEIWEPMPKILQ